jgi:probable rRNA maturation factor
LTVDVVVADRRPWAPSAVRLTQWATLAAASSGRAAELAVRVVGRRESRRLNRTWRGQDHATNVLSFPADSHPAAVRPRPLGDLVICAAVVADEARAQGKTLAAHWAHMVVHGVLHLLGHDHELEPAAHRMERRERRLLAALGFPDPYLADAMSEEMP